MSGMRLAISNSRDFMLKWSLLTGSRLYRILNMEAVAGVLSTTWNSKYKHF